MRHTAQMLHTAHTTRLYKCHTQPVWLDKHSAKKKEELYIFKRQHRWWLPSLTAMLMWFFLTEQHVHSHWHYHCSHHLRWQWEHHYCMQNSNMRGHVTCSYCNTHWNVLTYDNILKRVPYHVPDSWCNRQKSTHLDSKSESHWCITADESSSNSVWCVAVQTEHSHWTAQEWLLFEKSEHTEQAAADQQEELNQHQQLQEWEQQHMHCKEWELCELLASRHISVQHLHCCCCWCWCCWACCTRVSADILIKKGFTYKSCEWRSWRRKKKKSCTWGEGFITQFTDK